MIIRQWRGRSDRARQDAYPAHFRAHVIGELRTVDGFLGAELMRRTSTDDAVEFTVLTRWASMDAIRAFAGDDPTRAVVEPGAQAVLTDYDRTVTHHTVVDRLPSGLEAAGDTIDLSDLAAPASREYDIRLEASHEPLETIDVTTLTAAVTSEWHNQTLCRVNDCVVRLGVMHGDFHWHRHDDQDEFFYVVAGRWVIELPGDRTVELDPGQAFTVPRGVDHFPRAPEPTVLLMVEGAGIAPTGDAPHDRGATTNDFAPRSLRPGNT